MKKKMPKFYNQKKTIGTSNYFQFFLFTHICSVPQNPKITFPRTVPVPKFSKTIPYPYIYRPVLIPNPYTVPVPAIEISKPNDEGT